MAKYPGSPEEIFDEFTADYTRAFGRDLVLVGNIDVGVLCAPDLDAVRREVRRCMKQGAPGGGYMIATCNSIFDGMNPLAVAEMFRYEIEIGAELNGRV